jgi:cytochrome c-type biogenesis protein CcmF
MTPGTLLVALGFLAAAAATVLFAQGYVRGSTRTTLARRLVALAAGAFAGSLALLTVQFVTTDYTNAYVWQNTADYLPVLYRVTGVYAANAGSVLLWATLVSVVALWAATVRDLRDRGTALVQTVAMAVVAYFGGMLLAESPFAHVRTALTEAPPGFVPTTGQGLNPLLVDPYMAIHPPVMFVGYALLTVPFAIGVAHFVSVVRHGRGLFGDWLGSVTRWLRVAWLFLTAAVSLGALWSYTVLGWGGIWAWDPVETAILVPWLFLTATLHAVTSYRAEGRYAVLAPAMTSATFALAVYTTSVVRSGVFRSVHSFATDGVGPALLVLMGITALLGVGLPVGYWLGRQETEEASTSDREWLTRANLLHLAVLLLGLLAFVSMWGLTFPLVRDLTTGIEVSVEPRYYNLWSYPVVLGILLLLGFYMDYDVEGRQRSLFALGLFATATLIAALVAPTETWRLAQPRPDDALVYQVVGNASALSVFPPVAYVGIGVVKRGLARVPVAASRNAKLKEVGIVCIHLGVAVLAFSLTFTYLFTGQASVIAADVTDGGNPGEVIDVPDTDYSLRVLDYERQSLPENPAPETYARSPSRLLGAGPATNGTVQTVHGEVTAVRSGSAATVVQLDGSGLWLGIPQTNASALSVREGQHVVARGLVLWNYVPQADAVVLTAPEQMGTAANPPDGVGGTRVESTHVDLSVYRDGRQVVAGRAGQRTYVQQGGLQVRDVLVDRGLVSDTYVIAGVSDGTASVTVKRIPFMTAIRLGVLLLLAGMSLVFLFDPLWGVAELDARTESTADRAVDTSD